MVANKHVDAVPRIGIVLTRTDLNVVLLHIVIPLITVLVSTVGILAKFLERGDACTSQELVAFYEERETNGTILGYIEVVRVIHGVLHGVTIRLTLHRFEQRVSQTRLLQCFSEDAEEGVLTQLVRQQAVGTCQHAVEHVQHAVLQLVVDAGNLRIRVHHGVTRCAVHTGRELTSEHGGDGGTGSHIYSPVFAEVHEVELGNIHAERV